MQQLIIVGHIGADAETKDLGTTQVINFSLAVTEIIKKETKTVDVSDLQWYDQIKLDHVFNLQI